jgi:predicted RNA-binding Zn-ribbon protein involved in translation (DUF1610 family)
MNTRNPKFWALIGFGVGAVIAAAGTMSSPFESIVGGLIQAAIWFGISSLILQKKNKTVNSSGVIIDARNSFDIGKKEPIKIESVKTCDKCKSSIPMLEFTCFKCGGTMFSHTQVNSGFTQESSEEALSRMFSTRESSISVDAPEFKTCPMCAEQIRYAAKKCRYCQHLLI